MQALRLAAELRGRYPPELVAAALTQQSLRVAAREKFSRADEMYFTRAGLEQASAELVAAHSARRFTGLAAGGRPVLRDRRRPDGAGQQRGPGAGRGRRPGHAEIRPAKRGRSRCHRGGVSSCANVQELPPSVLRGVSAAFIDPARRSRRPAAAHRRHDAAAGLVPGPGLPTSRGLAIKAAPGLPHDVMSRRLGSRVRRCRPHAQGRRCCGRRASPRRSGGPPFCPGR